MSKIIHTTEETKELGIPSDNTQEPMQEDTIPTTISVAIIGFYDINTALSQFSVRMRLILNFPSLVPLKELNSFKTGGNRVYYHPDTVRQSLPTQSTQFHNSITTEWQENEFYNEKQGHLVFHTSDDGSSEDSLCLERVLNGTFKHPFELQMFPFDKQNLPISIRFWNSSIHDFKRAYEVKQLPRSMHISEQMARFPDWTVDFDAVEISCQRMGDTVWKPGASTKSGKGPLDLKLEIPITRLWGYYFTSLTANLIVIIVLTLCTFELEPDNVESRLNTTITLLLAAVATKFVVSGDIPRVSYLTLSDVETITTLMFILFVGLSHVYVPLDSRQSVAYPIAAVLAAIIILFMLYMPIMSSLASFKQG